MIDVPSNFCQQKIQSFLLSNQSPLQLRIQLSPFCTAKLRKGEEWMCDKCAFKRVAWTEPLDRRGQEISYVLVGEKRCLG